MPIVLALLSHVRTLQPLPAGEQIRGTTIVEFLTLNRLHTSGLEEMFDCQWEEFPCVA